METMWKKLLASGRWLWSHLRPAVPVMTVAGMIALMLAIWWLGPRWQTAAGYPLASWQARALVILLMTLILVLLWGGVLALRLRRVNRARAARKREQDDPVLVLERRQQRLLDRQLEALKEQQSGRPDLYRQPWYLVMGLEGAGKTSLVQRSGLSCTLSRVVRNGHTDLNPLVFDWWISDKGVLIDPDGELISQAPEDPSRAEISRRLWQHFLHWLAQKRPQRPLNGVVLVVDLADLGIAGSEQRQNRAATLRMRLQELIAHLDMQLPVYVCFSRMDRLYGFMPFVRTLSGSERDQPLGFTFRRTQPGEADAWLEEFGACYDDWIRTLEQRLPELLVRTREPEERAAVFSFSRQLAGLKPVLESFLADVLAADAFATPPLVRGTYFTSVLQQGVPEDVFLASVTARYRLSPPVHPAQGPVAPMSLFTRRLFAGVIWPEAGLAGDSYRRLRRRQRRLAGAAVMAVLAGAGITLGWQHYYIRNVEAGQVVESRVRDYLQSRSLAMAEQDATGRNLLKPLDMLREASMAFGDYHRSWPLVADMGLYQGHRVGPEVDAAYRELLAYRYLPALMSGVLDELVRAPAGSGERLTHLRVLRMLYDASGRRTDIVSRYMAGYWQRAFPERGDLQERLMEHLRYAMAHTDLAAIARNGDRAAQMALAPFRSHVQRAQLELGRVDTADRVFRELEAMAHTELPAPLDLARASGPAFATVFTGQDAAGVAEQEITGNNPESPLILPALLTRDGLESWFLRRSGRVTELALVDAWVLGRRQDTRFSKADEEELLERLHVLYADRYVSAWRQALTQVNIQRFEDLNHGVRILENLSGRHTPLIRLLEQVRDNTLLLPPIPDESAAASVAPAALPAPSHPGLMKDIQRQFDG